MRGSIHECRACNETATGPTPAVLWQADRTRVSCRPGHAPTERVFPRSDRASASGSALYRGPEPSRACSSVDRASASEAEGRRSESCRARHSPLGGHVFGQQSGQPRALRHRRELDPDHAWPLDRNALVCRLHESSPFLGRGEPPGRGDPLDEDDGFGRVDRGRLGACCLDDGSLRLVDLVS